MINRGGHMSEKSEKSEKTGKCQEKRIFHVYIKK